ncbi:MAG: DsbA family protein [Caldilineaceae bacterium]|nr:DsbA family protein [Caldilineaceae bacterium]
MPISVTIYHDFVCPYCYLSQFLAQRLQAEKEIEITWRAYLLNPATPPEGRALPPHVQTNKRQIFAKLYALTEELGVPFQIREPVSNSLRAHEAAEVARSQGKYRPLQQALLRRYFGEGEDLYAWETIRSAAEQADLDPDAIQDAVASGQYRDVVMAQYATAKAQGIEQIPTFIFDETHRITGLQPYDVYAQTVDRLRA